jgi:hypothetical protein
VAGRKCAPCASDGTWEELETVPEEFTDAGNQVLVTVYYSARGRGRRNRVRGGANREIRQRPLGKVELPTYSAKEPYLISAPLR